MTFVLDGSMALSLCFEDEVTPTSFKIEIALETGGAIVPAIWWLEFINGLIMAERRGRLSREDRHLLVARFDEFSIDVDVEAASSARREVMRLAESHRLTSYDAAYLELASRRGVPLASLDSALVRAARAVGVSIIS